jgi:hypothetical protein
MKIALFHNPRAGNSMLNAKKLVRQFESARYEVLYASIKEKDWGKDPLRTGRPSSHRWGRWYRQSTCSMARRPEIAILHSASWDSQQLRKILRPNAHGREYSYRLKIETN